MLYCFNIFSRMAIHLNLDKICGICLQEGTLMSSIFEHDEAVQITYSDKVEKCFPGFNKLLEQNKVYEIPNQICSTCIEDLDTAYRFHNNCETAVLLFTPISQDLVNETSKVQTASFEAVQKVENSNNNSSIETHTNDSEQAEYEDICEHFTYDEEHLDEETNEGEIDDDVLNTASETESTTLDSEIKIHIKNTQEETPVETKKLLPKLRLRLKDGNLKLQTFKPNKKGKEKNPNAPKICEICGNTYKYQHALNSHMRRHMNEKPYSCECCDKAFVSNVELRRHMRVHTGDKPYSCSYCERKFSDYGSRIKHERTHTGERPFGCPTCHKRFAYAHVLSVHLRTHTGEKKFQCPQCGKGFTKKSYMLAHIEQHRRSELLVLKEEEEESQDNFRQQELIGSNSVINHSDGFIDQCITTYIVEEIDGDNNDIKTFKNIDEVGEQLQDVQCNASILGI